MIPRTRTRVDEFVQSGDFHRAAEAQRGAHRRHRDRASGRWNGCCGSCGGVGRSGCSPCPPASAAAIRACARKLRRPGAAAEDELVRPIRRPRSSEAWRFVACRQHEHWRRIQSPSPRCSKGTEPQRRTLGLQGVHQSPWCQVAILREVDRPGHVRLHVRFQGGNLCRAEHLRPHPHFISPGGMARLVVEGLLLLAEMEQPAMGQAEIDPRQRGQFFVAGVAGEA